jgi:hypothetical protein
VGSDGTPVMGAMTPLQARVRVRAFVCVNVWMSKVGT